MSFSQSAGSPTVRMPLSRIVILLLVGSTLSIVMSANLIECSMSDHAKTSAPGSGVVRPLYTFTGKLFTTLNGDPRRSENIIFSPVSIHTALNMVLLGADPNTTTKRELIDTMGYANLSDSEITKHHEAYAKMLAEFRKITEQTLAAQKEREKEKSSDNDNDDDGGSDKPTRSGYEFGPRPPVIDLFSMMLLKNKAEARPGYKANIKKYYESTVEIVKDDEPASKEKIIDRLNAWAKEAGFDSPIMGERDLERDFEAILLSAVRVHAYWFRNFHQSKEKEMFFNQGLKNKPVDGEVLSRGEEMRNYLEFTDAARATDKEANEELSSNSSDFKELSEHNFRVVQVPLEGHLTYTIFEPLEHSTSSDNKLNKLVGQLFSRDKNNKTNLARVLRLIDNEEMSSRPIRLSMPKFKFEQEIGLTRALQTMGLRKAFDRTGAQISQMTGEKLHISDVKHQAVIDVNASGIKAAGITRIEMMTLSAVIYQVEPTQVDITKPFMFLIRYQGIPLFIGQLSKL